MYVGVHVKVTCWGRMLGHLRGMQQPCLQDEKAHLWVTPTVPWLRGKLKFLCFIADFTLSLMPRSITMALALPIAAQLHASAGITALGVMLTGL